MGLSMADLPKYLKMKRGLIPRARTVGLIDRIIDYPQHIKKFNPPAFLVPVLIDIIGFEENGIKYYARGKVVGYIGRSFLTTTPGHRILVLVESSIRLVNGYDDYVELSSIYNNKMTNLPMLYATKVLSIKGSEIQVKYPEFVDIAVELYRNKWNVEKVYANFDMPVGYHYACASVDFPMLESKETDLNFKNSYMAAVQAEIALSDGTKTDKPKIECRKTAIEEPYTVKSLHGDVEKQLDKLQDTIKSFALVMDDCSDLEESKYNDAIKIMGRAIRKNWRRAKTGCTLTGRALWSDALERMYPDFVLPKKSSSTIAESIEDITFSLLTMWTEGNEVPTEREKDEFYIVVKNTRLHLYFMLVDILLKLRGKLANVFEGMQEDPEVFYQVISTNPYTISLYDARLGVEELDMLAMLYKVNRKEERVRKFRNAANIHSLMVDTNNKNIGNSTLICENRLKSIYMAGLILSKQQYTNLQDFGCIFKDTDILNMSCYIDKNITRATFDLPKTGWKEQYVGGSIKYVYLTSGESVDIAIQNYIDSGLGIKKVYKGVTYIMDIEYAQKELAILERLYALSKYSDVKDEGTTDEPVITDARVESCIRGFERQKALEYGIDEFKLEDRQKDAVRLLGQRVMSLTGPAGSGKTTTAEALIYGLQALYGYSEESIMFCAPTGKAANRLKEVVKKQTRTVNSLFRIGTESHNLVKSAARQQLEGLEVLIIDESSMITLNLMYEMIMRVPATTRIIFLGDIEQLPPIGAGKPFADILHIFPCVALNVSKRASDKSYITRNAKTIITTDTGTLLQGPDFRMLEVPMEDIQKMVRGICAYHLGKVGTKASSTAITSLGTAMSPDDIQVVTPVNNGDWGTKKLNKLLQNVFNPTYRMGIRVSRLKDAEQTINKEGKKEKVKGYTEFRVNDRVMHLKNDTKATRLIKDGDSFYRETTTGIMNGDVGKVIGFYTAKQLNFVEDVENLSNKLTPLDKEFAGDADVLFMGVQYKDIDENGNPLDFVLLYRTDKVHTDIDTDTGSKIIEVTSKSLDNLDLAYALTVHKVQGSQSKLIIGILYNTKVKGFISRNMVYTLITRASEGEYLLGNISGNGNALDSAREIDQLDFCDSITDKLYA